MSTQPLTLGLIQHPCGADPVANLAAAEDGARTAAERGAHLVLLQELHNTPYFCQSEDPAHFELAEPIPGPTTERLGELAHELGVVIVGSVFERRAAGLYHNTAVVLERDGRLAGRYRKMHIPDDPGYYEKFYFTPGEEPFEPIDTSVARIGVLVCWDQWYPEAARLMALSGAEILLYPSAIGWDPRDDVSEQTRQREAWITIQRSHAIANGIPVAACNRIGVEADPTGQSAGIAFWGSSFIAGPQGELLGQGATDTADTVVTTIDRERTDHIRRMWPYLRDRRIDAYSPLLCRYRDS